MKKSCISKISVVIMIFAVLSAISLYPMKRTVNLKNKQTLTKVKDLGVKCLVSSSTEKKSLFKKVYKEADKSIVTMHIIPKFDQSSSIVTSDNTIPQLSVANFGQFYCLEKSVIQ